MIIVPILTTSHIHIFSFKGWENVLFELGSEGVKLRNDHKLHWSCPSWDVWTIHSFTGWHSFRNFVWIWKETAAKYREQQCIFGWAEFKSGRYYTVHNWFYTYQTRLLRVWVLSLFPSLIYTSCRVQHSCCVPWRNEGINLTLWLQPANVSIHSNAALLERQITPNLHVNVVLPNWRTGS